VSNYKDTFVGFGGRSPLPWIRPWFRCPGTLCAFPTMRRQL